jgi:integrase
MGEIHFERALWIIPPERMKMDNPHLVPLSRQAISTLSELKEMNGNREYIFPHHSKPRKHMSNGKILQALKRMSDNGKMTGHGFRSLALGLLKEKLGYTHGIANRQLAHVLKDSTNRAYDRALFLPQRTEMMQGYGDYIDSVYLQELSKKIKLITT